MVTVKFRLKKSNFFLLAVLCVSVLASGDVSARRRVAQKGAQGWGADSEYNRLYDKGKQASITGEVVTTGTTVPMPGMSYGIYMSVKAVSGTVTVHLAPGWFIENQDFIIAKRDKVTVKGSMVVLNGEDVMFASEVRKENLTLKLRDRNGFPLWCAWRAKD
jgi:hypothetical protein